MIATIAVAAAVYAIDKPYSYLIPPGMTVEPGVRVIIPFGRGNRRSEGIVLTVSDEEQSGLKPIDRVMDEVPVLSEPFIRMAAFLRERYFCTFYDAIKAMLPAGFWFQTAEVYSLTDSLPEREILCKSPQAMEVLQAVEDRGGSAARSDLKQIFSIEDLDSALNLLIRKKFLQSNLDFTKKVRDKSEQIAALAVSAEEALGYAGSKQKSAPMQAEVLKLLSTVGSAGMKEICYLTGASTQTIRRLERLGFVSITQREVYRTPLPMYVEPAEAMILNTEQQLAYDGLSVQRMLDKPGVALLHGVTGSGKTAVYLKLIRDTLDQGKSAVFLVPEIALTPQLIQLLMSHFGDAVAVLHSALRVTERYDEWKRIQSGKARIVIGTRSAVFAPVQNLGLLILDEEQEHTYKSENSPRYHAREVAIYRGSRERALVLLGSATPSLETMYLAKNGVYSLWKLTSRYNGRALPLVEIVDLKQEIREGNSSSLSKPLQMALSENIKNQKQSILFINRRGAGRCLICVECGEVPQCPRCSVSLTYHKANHRLMCHYCGHSQPVIDHCRQCGAPMKIVGTGTQKVEQELQTLFPGVPVLRMDADTISASNNHEAVLDRFQTEKIPILIGTQMVTKGLNFEDVTLVGVIDADTSLYVHHYRALETTFSMLTQVIGRAGRGSWNGRAMVQTMTPEHSVIRLAAKQDYDQFYEQEITLRQLHRFPPFGDLFTVQFSGLFESNVLEAAHRFRRQMEAVLAASGLTDVQLLGPAPAAVTKINNSYRYRLTLLCSNKKLFRLLLSQELQKFLKDKANKGITAFADTNSYE